MSTQEQRYLSPTSSQSSVREQSNHVPALPVASLVAVLGLAALAALYFGPDLVRYIKIRNM